MRVPESWREPDTKRKLVLTAKGRKLLEELKKAKFGVDEVAEVDLTDFQIGLLRYLALRDEDGRGVPVEDIGPEYRELGRYQDSTTGEIRGLGLVRVEQDLSECGIYRLGLTEAGRSVVDAWRKRNT